jgi:hypothetical protein
MKLNTCLLFTVLIGIMTFQVAANLDKSFLLLIFSTNSLGLFEKCRSLKKYFLSYYQRSLMAGYEDYVRKLLNETFC